LGLTGSKKYDPLHLPLRSHDEILVHAHEDQFTESAAAAECLSKLYGIKGVSVLSTLPSLFFPLSFQYDFIHLVYENIIKNLVLLWTGAYKGLTQGSGEYEFWLTVWNAIGAVTVLYPCRKRLEGRRGPEVIPVHQTHTHLQFEYTKDNIVTLQTGFASWVEEYEK
jgi:hypothetical protein